MRAMVIDHVTDMSRDPAPLKIVECPVPVPGEGEVLVKISACGVCHTELDEIEGRAPPPVLPVIPGHQVVGRVEEKGKNARRFKTGDRVGVAWIYSACGRCEYCSDGRENLCPDFMATGRDANGGYAQYIKVSEEFACPIPDIFSDLEAAPLLCAGAVGYRALKAAGIAEGRALGLTGFGASGHIVLAMAKSLYPGLKIYVFARSAAEREFARHLGAAWAGHAEDVPPEKMQAVIDTTPAWKPDVEALKNLAPGGRLVINAIRKENHDRECLLNLDYARDIWMEKEIRSVANVTRRDVTECLELAARAGIKPEFQQYALEEANLALQELTAKKIRGAKVLDLNRSIR